MYEYKKSLFSLENRLCTFKWLAHSSLIVYRSAEYVWR